MNRMSSPADLRVCVKGWRVIQTAETAGKSVHNLPSVDPILYLNSFFNSAIKRKVILQRAIWETKNIDLYTSQKLLQEKAMIKNG